MVTEGAIFGCDGCDMTDNLRTDAVSETNFGAVTGRGATTVDCEVNFDGNVGVGKGVASGASTAGSAGMVRLRIAAIFKIEFCILYPNDREGKIALGSARIEIMSLIYWQI